MYKSYRRNLPDVLKLWWNIQVPKMWYSKFYIFLPWNGCRALSKTALKYYTLKFKSSIRETFSTDKLHSGCINLKRNLPTMLSFHKWLSIIMGSRMCTWCWNTFDWRSIQQNTISENQLKTFWTESLSNSVRD